MTAPLEIQTENEICASKNITNGALSKSIYKIELFGALLLDHAEVTKITAKSWKFKNFSASKKFLCVTRNLFSSRVNRELNLLWIFAQPVKVPTILDNF